MTSMVQILFLKLVLYEFYCLLNNNSITKTPNRFRRTIWVKSNKHRIFAVHIAG